MCVHIGADVVLANLLVGEQRDQGVSFQDINMYCQKVKQKLNLINDDDFVCFAVNQRDVQEALLRYPHLFNVFRNRFFSSESLKADNFNRRYSSEISTVLQSSAL